jgi:hypothetical protein
MVPDFDDFDLFAAEPGTEEWLREQEERRRAEDEKWTAERKQWSTDRRARNAASRERYKDEIAEAKQSARELIFDFIAGAHVNWLRDLVLAKEYGYTPRRQYEPAFNVAFMGEYLNQTRVPSILPPVGRRLSAQLADLARATLEKLRKEGLLERAIGAGERGGEAYTYSLSAAGLQEFTARGSR